MKMIYKKTILNLPTPYVYSASLAIIFIWYSVDSILLLDIEQLWIEEINWSTVPCVKVHGTYPYKIWRSQIKAYCRHHNANVNVNYIYLGRVHHEDHVTNARMEDDLKTLLSFVFFRDTFLAFNSKTLFK